MHVGSCGKNDEISPLCTLCPQICNRICVCKLHVSRLVDGLTVGKADGLVEGLEVGDALGLLEGLELGFNVGAVQQLK